MFVTAVLSCTSETIISAVATEEQLASARSELEKASGGDVMLMSSVARTNTTEVLRALRAEIDDDRVRQNPVEEEAPWQP